MNIGTVNIPIFMHTLRFKKMMNPRWSKGLYVAMAYTSIAICLGLLPIFTQHPFEVCMACGGLLANLFRHQKWVYKLYSILAMLVFLNLQGNLDHVTGLNVYMRS